MQELKNVFNNAYILCLCEGSAEKAIMNMLIDEGRLVFNRESLIYKKVHPRMKIKQVQNKFLNRSFEKQLVILRILDSKNENFNLDRIYKDRFWVTSCLTKPEIEILIIHDADKFKEFCKVKSTIKPSEFCKTELGYKNIKTKKFIPEYFDIDRLVEALKKYKQKCKKDHYTIYDLIK